MKTTGPAPHLEARRRPAYSLIRSAFDLSTCPFRPSARRQVVTGAACGLSNAECFRKYVVTADLPGLKAGKDGWWSMPCPVGRHGKPVRFFVGKYARHIYWQDLGKCPDTEVFPALVKLGFPAACLVQPKGVKAKSSSEEEGRLAGAMLDIAFGEGSATERLIRMTLLAADGEMPEGPMVEVFAANLRVSPASIYRATAEVRRSGRKWQASP